MYICVHFMYTICYTIWYVCVCLLVVGLNLVQEKLQHTQFQHCKVLMLKYELLFHNPYLCYAWLLYYSEKVTMFLLLA